MNDTDSRLRFPASFPKFEVNCLVKLVLVKTLNIRHQGSNKCEKFVQILKMRQENALGGILWGNWLDMSVLAQEANSSSSC